MAVKVAPLFWWTKPFSKAILVPFWWIIAMAVVFLVPFLRPWWWVFAPLFLAMETKVLYRWWIRWDYNYAKTKWVTLEVITPKEILVPPKAMEDVFSVMWGPLYGPANWRETWLEGAGDSFMSWELASIEGNLHYYMRVTTDHRLSLETILYSHYPDLEIHEVPDYTRNVPQNIPNAEWDVYGEDFITPAASAYPIKTYEKFFEPQGERISAEEKRIDPISSLLELMSKMGPGEQFWLQFVTTSIQEEGWIHEGKKIVNKIAGRPDKHKKTITDEIFEVVLNFVFGPEKVGKDEYKMIEIGKSEEGDRELLITPGEREIVTEIENKLKKQVFRTSIRGVYVAKRENWKPGNRILPRAYFSHFQTQHMNHLRFSTTTRPKTHYVFRRRIPYLRTRRMFRNYVLRFPSFFPDLEKEVPILNGEEMATIYHFPIKISGLVLPTMERVDSKKGGPPPNLPT